MEVPFLYDQYDIVDFLDEGSFAEQEDIFRTSLPPNVNSHNSFTSIPRNSLRAPTASECTPMNTERPAKHGKTNGYNVSRNQRKPRTHRVSSSPIVLTFGNPTVPEMNQRRVILGSLNAEDDAASSEVLNTLGAFANLEDRVRSPRTPKKSGGRRRRPASQTYDHIMAERKRREQLSQRFLALSRLVPGIKKMDKSSVLGETIQYLKQLQETVKTLEEQSTKPRVETYLLVKRSEPLDEDGGSSDETRTDDQELSLPEIEVKLCGKHALLRVHCEKNKRVLINLLTQVENLNLTVTSTNFIPFGSFAIDITITAEMPKEFNLTMKEMVKALQSALRRPTEADRLAQFEEGRVCGDEEPAVEVQGSCQ